ncbi:MAG: hypothetical protein ACYC2K_07040 [Gemmatimonadales bacterium]
MISSPCVKRSAAAIGVLVLLGTSGLSAQEPTMPPGWRAVTDSPGRFVAPGVDANLGESWNFTRMPPGWHITNGPGMLLFDPSLEAKGRYQLETDFFLFPDPTDQPVGLFIAGRDLDAPDRVQWLGLLVRRDGTTGVVHHRGAEDVAVVPYRMTDSLTAHPNKDSQRIVLTIDAEQDSLRFSVNRARVGAIARASFPTEGQFGFRIGRGLNLHVVRLDYTQRIAPGRTK